MYTIINVPSQGRVKTEVPFLYLNGKLLIEQVAYVRHLLRLRASPSTAHRVTTVIAKFWEYCSTEMNTLTQTSPNIFLDFEHKFTKLLPPLMPKYNNLSARNVSLELLPEIHTIYEQIQKKLEQYKPVKPAELNNF